MQYAKGNVSVFFLQHELSHGYMWQSKKLSIYISESCVRFNALPY